MRHYLYIININIYKESTRQEVLALTLCGLMFTSKGQLKLFIVEVSIALTYLAL